MKKRVKNESKSFQLQVTCFRDTLIVGIVNAGTSIFAGFVIFSFLGYLSFELEEPIEKVAQSGEYMHNFETIFV